MNPSRVGILGARSLVGTHLISQLQKENLIPVPFSRTPTASGDVKWSVPDLKSSVPRAEKIELWIGLLPIWVLPNYFEMLAHYGVKKVVAVSSTSVFSKSNSANSAEQEVAKMLADGESRLAEWAGKNNVSYTILRPTLIYGGSRDRNISELVRIIKRIHFFPLLGKSTGLRQPIFAGDVAAACRVSLLNQTCDNKSYNISGSEVLSYRDMVQRVFKLLNKKPLLISVPVSVFQVAVVILKILPRYRKWNPTMAERMNTDLVFDHSAAARDFGFKPQKFELNPEDFLR